MQIIQKLPTKCKMLQKLYNTQSLLLMKLINSVIEVVKQQLWCNNRNQSFKHNRKSNSTELSKAVCKLKQSGQSPQI